MSRKTKDLIALCVVIVLAVSIFAIVIYDAVSANKQPPELDIYIDTTPINYTDADKAAYAFKFSQTIVNLAKQLGLSADGSEVNTLLSRTLSAMSKARIPAEKLGKIADAIADSSQDIVDFFTTNRNIDEDDAAELLLNAKVKKIAEFSRSFFVKTTLNEEEFAYVLYQYMLANASTSYKQAMNKLGKNDYITFISNTFFLLNTLDEISQSDSRKAQSNVLQAALYELGSDYIDILDKAGNDTITKILGFEWNYSGTDQKAETLNDYSEKITSKVAFIFGTFGYAMREVKRENIDVLTKYVSLKDGKEKNDCLIYLECEISKVLSSALTSGEKYLEDNETEDVTAILKQLIFDAYRMRITITDEEEDTVLAAKYNTDFDKFAQSMNYFADKNLTLDEVSSMTDTVYYNELLNNAKNINGITQTLDDFGFNLIYIWMGHILSGISTEAQ